MQREVGEREGPLEDAIGETPDEMPPGLADEDRRKRAIRQLAEGMGGAARLVPELGEGKPEGRPHLAEVEGERLIFREVEGVGGDDHRPRCAGSPGEIAEMAEVLGARQIETDLFARLATGGGPRRIVPRLEPAAGKGHVAGPGIARAHRALDEQHLGAGPALAKHHRDRGIGGRDDGILRPVGRPASQKAAAYELDLHDGRA